MNVLILSESGYPFNEATAKIIKRHIDFNKDIHFFVVCKENKETCLENSNYTVQTFKSYNLFTTNFISNIKIFAYKVFRSIYSVFNPGQLYDSKRFYRYSKKIIKKNKIDTILSFSGWFSTQLAASKLATKYSIRYFAYYTDPFCFNFTLKKYRFNHLLRLEKKWLLAANKIIMPRNYYKYYAKYLGSLASKTIPLELPCFFEERQQKQIRMCNENRYILYPGTFSRRILNIDYFMYLLPLIGEKIVCLSNDKPIKEFSNYVEYMNRKEDDYVEFFSKSKAILIIDNIEGIQIPSKLFEACSSGKKIIFIYYMENSESLLYLKSNNTGNVLFIKYGDYIKKEDVSNFLASKNDNWNPLSNNEILSKFRSLLITK